MLHALRYRLSSGWSIIRIVYVAMGLALVYQSFQLQEWLAVGFGIYFAAMGLFGFGCAGGACGIPNNTRNAFNEKQ